MKKSLNLLGVVLVSAIIASTSVVSAGKVQFGYDFSKKTDKEVDTVQGTVKCKNPKKTEDDHWIECSITNSFTGTVSGSAEFNAFTAKVKVSASVEYGRSKTTTQKHKWTIEPKTTYYPEWGYTERKISGNMYRYKHGDIISCLKRKASYGVCPYFGGRY